MNKDISQCLDMLMTGQVLRNYMRKKGYSVRTLQKEIGLSCPQPIYRWLNGQTMPSLDNLYALGALFDVHLEDMLMPIQENLWFIHEPENPDRSRRFPAYIMWRSRRRAV